VITDVAPCIPERHSRRPEVSRGGAATDSERSEPALCTDTTHTEMLGASGGDAGVLADYQARRHRKVPAWVAA
jgi:hypothetical protein